jgi:hypothetical protein
MADQLDAQAQVLELLGVLQLDYNGAADVVISAVDRQLHHLFACVLHLPKLIPHGGV